MGIPESPYSRDFGDPIMIIGTPFCQRLAVQVDVRLPGGNLTTADSGANLTFRGVSNFANNFKESMGKCGTTLASRK